MAYDVGKITRSLQNEFNLFNRDPRQQMTNQATPEKLGALIAALTKLTSKIEAQRDTAAFDWTPDAGVVIWDRDMAAWKARLAAYSKAVTSAPPGDRGAVLWTVTAPLLIGYYGGPASNLPQQPLDAMTPFSLANQLDVAEAWREERWKLFWEDLKNNFNNLPNLVPWWVWAALATGAVLVGGAVIYGVTGRRRNNPQDEQVRMPRGRRSRALAHGEAA